MRGRRSARSGEALLANEHRRCEKASSPKDTRTLELRTTFVERFTHTHRGVGRLPNSRTEPDAVRTRRAL